MTFALPLTDRLNCSWCFVKLGSSVEIARPVVVNENGDSRVSRKCERLALRGSMVVSFGFVLVGAVHKGAVRRLPSTLSACVRSFGSKQLGLVQPEN